MPCGRNFCQITKGGWCECVHMGMYIRIPQTSLCQYSNLSARTCTCARRLACCLFAPVLRSECVPDAVHVGALVLLSTSFKGDSPPRLPQDQPGTMPWSVYGQSVQEAALHGGDCLPCHSHPLAIELQPERSPSRRCLRACATLGQVRRSCRQAMLRMPSHYALPLTHYSYPTPQAPR